jgi:hypothetical protein
VDTRRRLPVSTGLHETTCEDEVLPQTEEVAMSKRARKRRDRNKKGANHGKKPNT